MRGVGTSRSFKGREFVWSRRLRKKKFYESWSEVEIRENPPKRTLREMVFPNNMNLMPLSVPTQNWDLDILSYKFYTSSATTEKKIHIGTYLKDFEMACRTICVYGILDEYIRFITFPFSLQESTSESLYTLPKESVTTLICNINS